jgi:type I restriction enzyme S subunit
MKNKKVKNTVVPKLRFPEFRDTHGWKEHRLNQISEHIDKRVGNLQLITVSITAGVGFVTQVEKFGHDISGKQYKNYIELNAGEFAYNKGYSKKYPQGCIYKLKEFKRIAVPNVFICFRLVKNLVAEFFQGYFDNNYHGKQLQKFITSGARSDGLLNVNFNDFFNIILPVPDQKAEQQKIADCLSSLDELISAQSQKLEALKIHKKGLMQQLFPDEGKTIPKLRFPEFKAEWEETELGKFIEIKGRIGYRGYTTEDIVKEGEGAISLSPTNITATGSLCFDKVTYISWTKYKESPEIMLMDGYTVLVKTGSSYGKTALVKNLPEKMTINPQLVVLKPSKINSVFLFLYVSNYSIQKQIKESVVGGTIPTLSQENISKFKVLIPRKKEQQKIADCLSSLDELISVQSRKLETLKIHKKGLMQQIFPTMADFARRATISIENKITNNPKISVGDSYQ